MLNFSEEIWGMGGGGEMGLPMFKIPAEKFGHGAGQRDCPKFPCNKGGGWGNLTAPNSIATLTCSKHVQNKTPLKHSLGEPRCNRQFFVQAHLEKSLAKSGFTPRFGPSTTSPSAQKGVVTYPPPFGRTRKSVHDKLLGNA